MFTSTVNLEVALDLDRQFFVLFVKTKQWKNEQPFMQVYGSQVKFHGRIDLHQSPGLDLG